MGIMENICIKDIKQNQKGINVIFIILEVQKLSRTKENREVRTFKVGDQTACINFSIWDEPGKMLLPGDIIRVTKAYTHVFKGCLTLYSGKTSDIQKIGDFCMLFNEQINMSEPQNPALLNNGNNNVRQMHGMQSTQNQIQNSNSSNNMSNSSSIDGMKKGNSSGSKPNDKSDGNFVNYQMDQTNDSKTTGLTKEISDSKKSEPTRNFLRKANAKTRSK